VETAGFKEKAFGPACPETAASPATRTKLLEINLVNRKAPMSNIKLVVLSQSIQLVPPETGAMGSMGEPAVRG